MVEVKCVLEAPSTTMESMAYSSNCKYIFQRGDASNVLNVIHAATGELHTTFEHPRPCVIRHWYPSATNALQLWTCTADGKIFCWDIEDAVCLKQYDISLPILWLGSSAADSHKLYLVVDWSSKLSQNKKRKRSEKESPSKWALIRYDITTSRFEKKLLTGKTTNVSDFVSASIKGYSLSDVPYTAVSVIAGSTLTLWSSSDNSSNIVTKNHVRPFSTVDLHPSDSTQVVTGDSKGQISIWYNISSTSTTTQTKLHWHPHVVGSVAFSTDGNFLVSGGKEGVFVLWTIESGKRTFVPRLGSAIVKIAPSGDGASYAVAFANNSFGVINPVTMKLLWKHRGVNNADVSLITKSLVLEPNTSTSNVLVLNGSASCGSLQFYNVTSKKQLNTLNMSLRNEVAPTELNLKLPKTDVTQVAFSTSNNNTRRMVTLEECKAVGHCELKFWDYDTSEKSYVINSRVDQPHSSSSSLSHVLYHPRRDTVVICDSTGCFKVWELCTRESNSNNSTNSANTKSQNQQNSTYWACQSVVTYLSEKITAAAFSHDGSVLFIAYGGKITLWNPLTNSLIKILNYKSNDNNSSITSMFVSSRGYLVALSEGSIYVWNLTTLTLWWSYNNATSTTLEAFAFNKSSSSSLAMVVKHHGRRKLLLFSDLSTATPSFTSDLDFNSNIEAMEFMSSEVLLVMDTQSKLHQITLGEKKSLPNDDGTKTTTSSTTGQLSQMMLLRKKENNASAIRKEMADNSKGQALLDAPSHLLQPLSKVFHSFMDTMFSKERSVSDKEKQQQPQRKKQKKSISEKRPKKNTTSSTTTMNTSTLTPGFYKAMAQRIISSS